MEVVWYEKNPPNDSYTQVMPLKSNLRTPIIRATSVLSDTSVLPQNSKITILKIRDGKTDDSTFQRDL